MASVLLRAALFQKDVFSDGPGEAGEGEAHANTELTVPFPVSVATGYNEAEESVPQPLWVWKMHLNSIDEPAPAR